jgi:hypothetical protein
MLDPSVSIVGTQLGSTLLVVGSLQWLKKAKWMPLVKEGSVVINRGISLAAALGVAIGIHYTWNPSDNGTLILTGVTLTNVLHGVFHVSAQFIYQETGYNVLQGLNAMQQFVAGTPPVAPK